MDDPSIDSLPKPTKLKGLRVCDSDEDVCFIIKVPADSTEVLDAPPREELDEFAHQRKLTGFFPNLDDLGSHFHKKSLVEEDQYYPDNRNEESPVIPEEEIGNGQQMEDESTSSIIDCPRYTDLVTFAKALVSNVVETSEEYIEEIALQQEEECNLNEGTEEEHNGFMDMAVTAHESADFSFLETKKPEVTWPSIAEFTVQLGAYTIDEYLSSFDTEEDWMYVIYYQGIRESKSAFNHKYQAIYSMPTWKYPVAQATASIFFVIEVSKLKPSACKVDVSFQYETYRQVHRPGQSEFQERWLVYILDAKIRFFQTVTY